MLELSLSAQSESVRQELREWLVRNPPPVVNAESSLETFVSVGRAWQAQLASGGWVGVHWPKEFGGRGLSLVEEAVVLEELGRAGAPQLLGLFGLTMVGPVLIRHGTEAQKRRFLRNILHADEVWCQGFSEPAAGSDLVALKARAEITDEGFVLSGQKIWTSFAHVADWCFVLCRTSDEQKKHQGLTYLLVDMKSPGIDVRPLRQITGDSEFNEVFFDNVMVPKENVVGRVGDGWSIAISTLMFERVVLTFSRHLQSETALRALLGDWRASRVDTTDLAREVARACAVRSLAYDHLVDYASGKAPGPEGSLDKLFWVDSFQDIARRASQRHGRHRAYGEHHSLVGGDVHRYLYSRGRSIAAGTSEIQRNIIAERLLGLPRAR